MLSRCDRFPLRPGDARPFVPALPAFTRLFDNLRYRLPSRFPPIVIVKRHPQPPWHGNDYDGDFIGRVRQAVRDSRPVVAFFLLLFFVRKSMQDIAKELQKAVREAAGPITPGMSIKSQINAACENLGYPRGHWRVREAWYAAAGNWRAVPAFDLIARSNRYQQRNAAAEATNPAKKMTRLTNIDETLMVHLRG